MPELPEVEVVRAGLEPYVAGARVSDVDVLDPRSVRRHDAGPADFALGLTNATLATPARRGKFLWIPIQERDRALAIHLGMSGQMLVDDPGSTEARHARVVIGVEHPTDGPLRLQFADQRIFGWMAVRDLEDSVPDVVAHIARDPLDPEFVMDDVVARLRKRSQCVKAALLDQSLISGIGNIYADEALWATKLHYATPGHRLSAARARALIEAARDVMERALAEGGTSFDEQYVHVNGASGYFERSLHAYGREGLPCLRCGKLMVRESWSNRSSYRCPGCQRKPRA